MRVYYGLDFFPLASWASWSQRHSIAQSSGKFREQHRNALVTIKNTGLGSGIRDLGSRGQKRHSISDSGSGSARLTVTVIYANRIKMKDVSNDVVMRKTTDLPHLSTVLWIRDIDHWSQIPIFINPRFDHGSNNMIKKGIENKFDVSPLFVAKKTQMFIFNW
jgi:hypothetical protein